VGQFAIEGAEQHRRARFVRSALRSAGAWTINISTNATSRLITVQRGAAQISAELW